MFILEKPVFVLSKKFYAGGEAAIELMILDNKTASANITLTFKDNKLAENLELGKEYSLIFQKVAEKEG